MGGDWHMPKLRQHLAGGGINFTNCGWQGWESVERSFCTGRERRGDASRRDATAAAAAFSPSPLPVFCTPLLLTAACSPPGALQTLQTSRSAGEQSRGWEMVAVLWQHCCGRLSSQPLLQLRSNGAVRRACSLSPGCEI